MGSGTAGPDRIRTLIAADLRLLRDGLAEILERSNRIEVVARAADPRSAIELAASVRPAVAVVDLTMAEGVELVQQCARVLPEMKTVALSRSDREDELLQCAEMGMTGYVTSESSLADLLETIESVARGELLCSPRFAAALMRRVSTLASREPAPAVEARLTARELEILRLIDDGLSNKEIANQLYIELATVKNHVHNILEKLRVSRRGQAAAQLRSRPRPAADIALH
jgi:two-component system, NarL family, nitrate/nitrite response regulator NarL